MHLWDLSGNSEYLDVRNELYGNTEAVFLVYDVTNQSSFDSLDSWLRELTKYGTSSPEICLVANKVFFELFHTEHVLTQFTLKHVSSLKVI